MRDVEQEYEKNGYNAAIQDVLNLLDAETREQWRRDADRLVCAQMVAQKLTVLADVVRGWKLV